MDNIISSIVKKIRNDHPELIVESISTRKNNDVVLNGISIREKETCISPIIYIDGYLNSRWTIDKIASTVYDIYDKNKIDDCSSDIFSVISNYDLMKKKLSLRLVNYERNQKRFEQLPHVKFLDLGVYIVLNLINDREDVAALEINDNILSLWGKSFDGVYADALENLAQVELVCMSMEEFLKKMGITESLYDRNRFYIITNPQYLYGAAVMLNYEFMNHFSEKIQSDLVIIPSSVHEILILPAKELDETEWISSLVRYTNVSVIREEDVLSDHIYVFRKEKGWDF